MWVPRLIEGLLSTRAAQRPVVVLTGARQTGKTSLVRRAFGSYEYVSLDLPCRAANPYPITKLVQALPLEALPDDWA